ncbi:hypothetical protein Q8W71_16755 [Methylobacterium sp. NEAU 140]|nr:hypothetical protein [Methylobacterium sp. NEAU 140]MDP4024281.1 hypothetical protein [Methylobacterium sp. NEAU 140]
MSTGPGGAAGRGATPHPPPTLARARARATLVHAPTSRDALELFARDRLEAAAGVRQPLAAFAAERPGFRVLAGRFMAIEQAMATPRRRGGAAVEHLTGFVEAMKAAGFVAASLAASGQGDAAVAPPAGGA